MMLVTIALTTPGSCWASSAPPPPEASPYSERNWRPVTDTQVVYWLPLAKTCRTPVVVYLPSNGNPAPFSATGMPGRRSGLPVTATSSSVNEDATSSASARAACPTWDCVPYGTSVPTSSDFPNLAAALAGVRSVRASCVVPALAWPRSGRFVFTSQPRTRTVRACPAEVTPTRLCSSLVPNSRTYGLRDDGVESDGAPDADTRSVKHILPALSKYRRTSFSCASRHRKSQSVMLGWVASSYTDRVVSTRPRVSRLRAARRRAMSPAVMLG